jgi:putative N-acetylmannosamine-6-phosphate epimerase
MKLIIQRFKLMFQIYNKTLSKYFLKNTIELIAMQTATKQRKNEKYIQQKKQKTLLLADISRSEDRGYVLTYEFNVRFSITYK